MRIAIFSECYTPVTNGVVTSIQTLRETLREWGHTVYVFAPGTPQPDDDPDIFRLPELPFPRHPFHFARPFPRLTTDFAALDVDVIHCQHPFTIGRLGAETARKHGLPMVYTSHSLYSEMIQCAKSPLVRSMGPKAVRGFMRRFIAKADYVITPSRATRDALLAEGIRSRYVVVPTGINAPCVPETARETLRRELRIAPETPLILYVGRVGPEKRVDFLLRSAAALRDPAHPGQPADFHLVIVGDGLSRHELETMAEELGLSGRVTFVGTQPHETIGDWYAAADIFALPSPNETQGLVLIEAMATGLPCVAIDLGGPREIVLQGETGLRVPMRQDAFTHALDLLLRDPETRKMFGANGRIVAEAFSPEAMAKRVLTVYTRALNLPRPVPESRARLFATGLQRRKERTQARLRRTARARLR